MEGDGIEVLPGDSLTVPKIKLAVGKVMESVVVTAEVAGVTLSSPEHSTLITASDINRLSTTGRDAAELVSILPGFTLNAGANIQNQWLDYEQMGFSSGNMGSFGANGAAPQQGLVNITADGANVIDPGDMGAQVSNVNMDQVQEVKVQTSNFGADEANALYTDKCFNVAIWCSSSPHGRNDARVGWRRISHPIFSRPWDICFHPIRRAQ